MADFVFSSPQKSLYSEFGSRQFQFLKAPSPCAFFISTANFIEWYIAFYAFLGTPKVHFIRLDTCFHVNSTFKYDLFYVI